MTLAEERGATEPVFRTPTEAAVCAIFRCEYCLDFIGDGFPIFMFLNASYCSEECRRHGRSLRRRQIEAAGGMRRPSSYSSSGSNWSSMVSETCSASSAPTPEAHQAPAAGGARLIGWILGAGLRTLASMVKGTELIRAASVEWLATSGDLRHVESASLSDDAGHRDDPADLADQEAGSRRSSEAHDHTSEPEGAQDIHCPCGGPDG